MKTKRDILEFAVYKMGEMLHHGEFLPHETENLQRAIEKVREAINNLENNKKEI